MLKGLNAGHVTAAQWTVGDSGGGKGLGVRNVFCAHNFTSPSNDYAGVACCNNHTHVSVPY